jgi:hypothetical protein
MMRSGKHWIVAPFLALSFANTHAALIGYTDEALFLNDLAMLGSIVHEGFEGAAWDDVRTTVFQTMVSPGVSSNGITWTSNNPNGGVTTSSGAASTGDWGIYSSPHGSYDPATTACSEEIGEDPNPAYVVGACGDGFIGTADNGVLYGVGGWVRTNTPYAKIGMFIGGYDPDDLSNQVKFGESGCDEQGENCTINNAIIGTGHQFFGFIDTAGFTRFEFRELEGSNYDQKFIFADDFPANITMQFGAKPLFENISVKFGDGNRYGLIGANGCGKSTFMKILGGDLEPTAGQVDLPTSASASCARTSSPSRVHRARHGDHGPRRAVGR